MNLGNNIATLRKYKKMTQEKLAEQCNVSRQAVAKWESGESDPSIDKLITLSKIFNVRIDTLIKSNDENIKMDNYIFKTDYFIINDGIQMLNHAKYLDSEQNGRRKNRLLKWLYRVIKERYIDENGQVRERYLICNTKKEDREGFVCFINDIDESPNNPFNDYIQGNCEIDEVLNAIDLELEKRINASRENMLDVTDTKRNTPIIQLWFRGLHTVGIQDFEEYTDKYYEKLIEKFHIKMDQLSTDTFMERFMLFFANEIEMAIKNRDAELLDELGEDWWNLSDYIWYKAK